MGERTRLLKILEIAQNQVRDLEQHHKRLDHQHDVMQRRVIELQSLSDEKATIGPSYFKLSKNVIYFFVYIYFIY